VGYKALAPLDRWILARRPVVLAVGTLVALAGIALLPKLRFDFDPMHLRSPRAESVATLLDLAKDPRTAPDTIDVLAPSVDAAVHLGERLEKLPVVDHVLTLASFVPEDQDEKLALIGDAAMLLEPTLAPASTKPPPTDAETVAAMMHAVQSLDEARAANAQLPFAKAASRLAMALRALAGAPEATRERARSLLIPPLQTTLAQLRSALSAEPVALATLPDALRRDWVTSDGRARIEVYPKGDVSGNIALRRFVDAVLTVARTKADGIVMPAARGARRVRRPEVLIIVHQLLGGLPWCQSAPDRGYGPYPARPPARRSACLRVGRRKPPSLLVDEPRC